MTIGRPVALFLLIAVVALVFWTLRGRGYGRGRLAFLATLRMLLAVSVVLALAQVYIRLPSPNRHVVFLIDDSPSCADRLDAATTLVRERIRKCGPADSVSVFRFDGRAFRDDSLTGGASVPSSDQSRRKEDATDISAALDAALASVPLDHPAVVFLLSDGIETRGDSSDAAVRLAGRGIPVYIPRPSSRTPADVRVSELDAPPIIGLRQAFNLTCRVDSTRPASAEIEITRDGFLILKRSLAIAPDAPGFVTVRQVADKEGLHVYSAHVSAADDRFAQNNSLSTPVFVRAKPLIVYLAGYEGETPVEKLLKSLSAFRFVRLASGDDLTPEILAQASAVILDNFPAERLGANGESLATFVRSAGGGLFMIGGPGAFGLGGYINTAVDGVLPVHSDPRDADKKPLALAVALDSSGSMGENGGVKMEMARVAAVRTLSHLAPTDNACVIAFRVTPDVVVPFGRVGDPGTLAKTLAEVSPAGGTNIYPALDRALDVVKGRNARTTLRHVVILSDGRSQPGDTEAVIKRYIEAGVTLSAFATGTDADRELLRHLAEATGGRYYEATEIRQLPDLFLDDLRRIEGPLKREGALAVERGDTTGAFNDMNLGALPTAAAYNRTRLREGATLVLQHTVDDNPEPVLAVRRIGLGRSAALTLSFDATWVGDFARWSQWGNLVVKTVQLVERAAPSGDYELSIRRDGGDFDATVTALKSPDTAGLTLRLVDVSGESVDVALERTASRTYHALARTRVDGVATAVLFQTSVDGQVPVATAYVPTSYSKEFRDFTPRLDVLERIARITGGKVVDNLDQFRDAGGSAPLEQRDITWWLAALALVLFVTEIVGRALGRL